MMMMMLLLLLLQPPPPTLKQRHVEFIESFIYIAKSTDNLDCMIRLLHWCLSALTWIIEMCSAWGAITYRNCNLPHTKMKPMSEWDGNWKKKSQWKLSDRWISKWIDHTKVMVTKKECTVQPKMKATKWTTKQHAAVQKKNGIAMH